VSYTAPGSRRTNSTIYSQLLAASDAAAPEDRQELAGLVATLEIHRGRLVGAVDLDAARNRPLDAAEAVAAQLNYDLRLLRLCRVLGIPCDASRFSQPGLERRRLEAAVKAALPTALPDVPATDPARH